MSERKSLFIVWNPFQRRSETLAAAFDLDARYFHFKWEERGKSFKAISYIPKFVFTMWVLIRSRPEYVFVQLAPTPLLYTVILYRSLFGGKIVADCHNTMIYDDHWVKWPFAKQMLRRSDITLVHNDDVQKLAKAMDIDTLILRDPLPLLKVSPDIREVAGIDLTNQLYVIIPCGIAADEPVDELFGAIRAVPDTLFVMTWFAEKLPADVRANVPENLCLTGYLPEHEFNALYANARAALVLTTREGTQPSGASEAIALGVPLIMSALVTTKRLYGDAPVFVQNNADSIATGIRTALRDYDECSDAIISLRGSLAEDANAQIDRIHAVLMRK